MSYILSALKKAEAERVDGDETAIPPVLVAAQVSQPADSGKTVLALLLLLIAVLAGVLAYYLLGNESEKKSVELIAQPAPAMEESVTAQPSKVLPQIKQQEPVRTAIEEKPVVRGEPKKTTTAANWPNISVDGHLYVGSRASLRKVVINGQTLREGDSFSGITVQSIGEDSVVLVKDGEIREISAY